ncbi:hypothetical protein EOT10_05035 [Streptomyces antnestii]|uniref:Uncharacterized protein n=1 Tax=Streptomyces antnestii TaxID=2494256 RepID=A0A437PZK8_9ACTN|nr:hypothetical protein [Streptomyces sp. San01]RVU27673.1 hypothetical protein EOT10_05035 [Streptomyces sp. San01]
MESPEVESWYRFLIGSLAVVAARPDELITSWLDAHRFDIDDVVLDFECAVGPLVHLVEVGRVTEEIASLLRRITAAFDELSRAENAGRWTDEALATDPAWAEVRDLARRSLHGLTGQRQVPLPQIDRGTGRT